MTATDPVKIRTKMQPENEVEVPRWEADYLDSIGAVHHSRATTDEGARRSELRQQLEAKSPDPGDEPDEDIDAEDDVDDSNAPDTTENQER